LGFGCDPRPATVAADRVDAGPPTTHYGFLINTAEFFLVIPLFGATFGLFTGLLADVHVRRSEERIKQHVTDSVRGPDSHQAPGSKTG
jgi:hypothetical protein